MCMNVTATNGNRNHQFETEQREVNGRVQRKEKKERKWCTYNII